MANNTGNVIGSDSALDLEDNARFFDNVANSTTATAIDRFSRTRDTVVGRLEKMGYAVPIAYASGIVFSVGDNVKTVDEGGIIYAPLPSSLPFTTTNFGADAAKFFVIQGVTEFSQINDLLIAIEFDDISEFQSFQTILPAGKALQIKGRLSKDDGSGANWEVISGTTTANGFERIAHTTLNMTIVITHNDVIHACQFGNTVEAAQAAFAYYSSQTALETLVYDGIEYEASATPLELGGTGNSIRFDRPKFNFDIEFYRCLVCTYIGHFNTSGDVRNIGLLKSEMPSFFCNFWYLQNFAGWGGVNFAKFGTINSISAQVRQAANVGAVSSINEVKIDGLYCQNPSDIVTSNLWGSKCINFWIRGAQSNVAGAPVYTTDGTDPALTGLDKWENAITTSPFVIIHGDMSYADDALETWGIKQESDRPIVLLSDFIEGHTHATEGNVVRFNAEDRNSSAYNANGKFDVITNISNTQKWGNYKKTLEPIYNNYEFKAGLEGISVSRAGTGGGFLNVSNIPASTQSTSENFIKLVNTGEVSGARFTYSFVSKKTNRIQVGVRGINTGDITIKVGAGNTQFGLGYSQDDNSITEAYSVAASDVKAGEIVTVTVYTKGFATQDTGDETYITGFGVFYGSYAPTLYQTDLDFSMFDSEAPENVATDLFTITESTFINNFRSVTILTHNTVAGGGGEKIVLELGFASGGSSSALTITEVSRTAVNGVGGFSDNSGTLAISTTISGTSYTIVGTLANVANVIVSSKVGIAETA